MNESDFLLTPGPEIDRRAFLLAAGRAGAATLLGGGLLSAAARAAPPPPARPLHGGAGIATPDEITRWMAEIVADLEGQFPSACALYTRDEVTRVDVDRDGARRGDEGPREGIVLGVFDGQQFHEQGISIVSADGLKSLRDRLLAAGINRRGVGLDPGPALVKSWADPGRLPVDGLTPAEHVDRSRTLRDRLMKMEPRLLDAPLGLMTARSDRIFVNRTRRLRQTITRAGMSGTLIAGGRNGESPGVLGIRWQGVGGLEWFDVPDAELAAWLEQAGRLAGASSPPAGVVTVISAPDITGALAHEALGHGVEADLFRTGRARAAGFLGRSVGSPLVTIVDDPSKAGGNGFYFFDDEGVTAGPTTIVERGVLKSGLTDAFSARELKQARTANGRREAWDRKVYARMSNTFVAPGSTPPAELIAGVDRGLYVAGLQAGIEDPKGWGMQIVAWSGEWIEKGRRTGRLVGPVSLTGFVPEVLGSVDGVGNDFRLSAAMCGKGFKEFVPVGSGGPTLRFKARVS